MSFFTYLIETEDLVPTLTTENLPGYPTLGANYGAAATPDFALSNLQESDISSLYKTSPITGGFDNVISIDLGSSIAWNMLTIINHNFDPSIIVTVRSGSVVGLFTYTAVMTYKEFDMFVMTPTTRTDRYIEIRITDSITAAHAYGIGRLMVGLATTLTSNFNYDWERRHRTLNRSKRSDVNSRMVDKIIRYRELALSFSEMTDTQLAALEAFVDALYGDAFWTFIVPNPEVTEAYVMTLNSEATARINRRHRMEGLIFTEESRGVRIAA